MEQVAIITKLVEEMIAMNCGERHMGHFILNLDTAVRTLTHIKEDIPRQMAWEAKWEAGRAEREAKEAKSKEEYRAKVEAEEARKKEEKRKRRAFLYQAKKAEKKAMEVGDNDWRSKICGHCGGYNGSEWCVSCFGEKK
jgi:hypothetical protein